MTDHALETLDFLNFRASDDSAFRKVLENKALDFGAYERISSAGSDVAKRTRQLVYEWLSRFGKVEYSEDKGVHVYQVRDSPGYLSVRVVGERKTAFCRVLRSDEWPIDWNTQCQLTGLKQSLPLEHLLGSFPFWSGKRFPGHEIVKEVKHYFSHLNFSDKNQPYFFNGFLTYMGRLVPVRIDVSIGSKSSVCIEMHNNR